jgi:very-short-patch-repair endonuclease
VEDRRRSARSAQAAVVAAEFTALVREQAGAFTRAQARAAGFSAYRVSRRLRSGEWLEVNRRVLVVNGAADRAETLDWAGLLAGGPGATLGGPSAARRLGLEVPLTGACVVVPPHRHVSVPGVRVVRDTVDDADVLLLDGALVTNAPRTVLDCLRLLPERRALAYLDRALQRGWIDAADLSRRVQPSCGRRGAPRLARLVRLSAGGARSDAERRLVRLLRRCGLAGWIADVDVPGVGVVDLAFPAARLAIEVDGLAWHSGRERFQRDRTKQNLLVRRGWTVLRFTWTDLAERPDEVVALVRQTLAHLAAAAS